MFGVRVANNNRPEEGLADGLMVESVTISRSKISGAITARCTMESGDIHELVATFGQMIQIYD